MQPRNSSIRNKFHQCKFRNPTDLLIHPAVHFQYVDRNKSDRKIYWRWSTVLSFECSNQSSCRFDIHSLAVLVYEFQIIVYSKKENNRCRISSNCDDNDSVYFAVVKVLPGSTVTELISHCEQTDIVLFVRLRTEHQKIMHVSRDPWPVIRDRMFGSEFFIHTGILIHNVVNLYSS